MPGKPGSIAALESRIPHVTIQLEDSRGQRSEDRHIQQPASAGPLDRIVHRQTANPENRKGRL